MAIMTLGFAFLPCEGFAIAPHAQFDRTIPHSDIQVQMPKAIPTAAPSRTPLRAGGQVSPKPALLKTSRENKLTPPKDAVSRTSKNSPLKSSKKNVARLTAPTPKIVSQKKETRIKASPVASSSLQGGAKKRRPRWGTRRAKVSRPEFFVKKLKLDKLSSGRQIPPKRHTASIPSTRRSLEKEVLDGVCSFSSLLPEKGA